MKKIINKIKKFLYDNRNNKVVVFLDKLIYRFTDHNIISAGGSLVYFFILALFPFLIALLNVLNFTDFLSSESIINLIKFLPREISSIVMNFISEISQSSSGELLSFSIALAIWSASRGIKQIIKHVNIAYGFIDNRGYIKVTLISIVFTIALTVMIFMLLLTQVFGRIIIEAIIHYIGLTLEMTFLWELLNMLIPIVYMIIIFALLYKFSPTSDKRYLLRKKSIVPGALFATFGTIIVTKLFGFYVGHFAHYSITYGSLGGVIILLIWLWLMSMIILVGGEINAIIAYLLKNNDYYPREESVMNKFLKDYHP